MTSNRGRGKALILGPFVDPVGEEILSSELDVTSGDGLDEAKLAELIQDVDAAYVTTGRLGGPLIAEGTRLRVIGTLGSGTNRVDVAAATAANIPVINAAGAGYKAVAEHAIGMMLGLQKQIASYDRWIHKVRRYPDSDDRASFVQLRELEGKVLGVIGLGYIGRDLAEKARVGFNMHVCGFDPFANPFEVARQRIEWVRDLEDMLPRCDFVVVAAPLSEATRGLVGTREIAAMKSSAYLIAVSRGGVVDERALIHALTEGVIAGAGVDVFDPEPPDPDNPLFAMDNVIVTPHIAGATVESFYKNTAAVTQQMLEAVRGIRPTNVVNPQIWDAYHRRWFGDERS